MNREEMKNLYEQLKVKYETGGLTIDQFRTAMLKAKIRDSQGRFWMINPETGKWEVNAGGAWIEGQPPEEISGRQVPQQDETDEWVAGLRPSFSASEEAPYAGPPAPGPSRPKRGSARSMIAVLVLLAILLILVSLAVGAVLTNGFGIVDLGLW